MIPLYSVGHRLEAHYPMVPIAWEMGIGFAITSYNQKLYFGLMADAGAAPDVERLGGFLAQADVGLRAGGPRPRGIAKAGHVKGHYKRVVGPAVAADHEVRQQRLWPEAQALHHP